MFKLIQVILTYIKSLKQQILKWILVLRKAKQ